MLWGAPRSGRDSNEARLTTDCLFELRLRLGAVGREIRRKGRWVTGETGDDTEALSGSMEGKSNWTGDDIAAVGRLQSAPTRIHYDYDYEYVAPRLPNMATFPITDR